MSAAPDLFGAPSPRSARPWPRRPRPAPPVDRTTCPRTGRALRCACGRWATHGRGVCLRAGQIGTWTCGRVECAGA